MNPVRVLRRAFALRERGVLLQLPPAQTEGARREPPVVAVLPVNSCRGQGCCGSVARRGPRGAERRVRVDLVQRHRRPGVRLGRRVPRGWSWPSTLGASEGPGGDKGAFAALMGGGSVVSWGSPTGGGDSSPVQDRLDGGVQAICATGYAFAALRADGSAVAWGDQRRGGDASQVEAQLAAGVRKLFSSRRAFAALREDGSVVTWGDPQAGGDSSRVRDRLGGGVRTIASTHTAFAALEATSRKSSTRWRVSSRGNSGGSWRRRKTRAPLAWTSSRRRLLACCCWVSRCLPPRRRVRRPLVRHVRRQLLEEVLAALRAALLAAETDISAFENTMEARFKPLTL